jgi:hypothetical protein
MDENQLAQLYQQYLGRAPDPSGIATWSGQDPSAVIAGITGSQEYQNRGGGGGGGSPAPTSVENMQPAVADPSTGDDRFQYTDASGGTVTVDSSGNPVGYTPGQSWYQQQYAAHPDAIRSGMNNEQYLALGPLAQTQTINGVQVPITNAYEYQINPNTKALTSTPVDRQQSGGGFLDFMTSPTGALTAMALLGGAGLALPALAGEGALSAGMVDAAGNIIGAGSKGAAYGAAGATAADIASNPVTQEMIDFANASPDPIQAMSEMQNMTPKELANALGPGAAAATAGLTAADLLKYGLPLSGILSNLFGGSGSKSGSGLTGGTKPTASSNLLNLPKVNYGSSSGSYGTGMELTGDVIKGNPNYTLGAPTMAPNLYTTPSNPALLTPQAEQAKGFAAGGYADGGEYQEHNPSFYSEGGMENRYVQGDGDGTSDDVAAMLANGEFVIPADVVAALGNGSNDAGAHVLDQFLSVVREDNHSNDPDELPPESKGPLAYLAQARKRA